MPKSASSASPPTRNSKAPKDNDVLRKKKNADAQAAFRQRRQNYITTLEETVTSLESVVLQLQQSCRETGNENMELRQEVCRLRYENREREKSWRAFAQVKKTGHAPEAGDPPQPTLASPFLANPTSQPATLIQISDAYGNGVSYTADSGNFVNQQAPAVYEPTSPSVGSFPPRGPKYAPYPLSRDGRWQAPPTLPTDLDGSDSVTPQSQSPSYIESPPLTSPADITPYPGRFPPDERKVALDAVLDNAPYVFPNAEQYHNAPDSIPNSRSMSPTTSSASSSTSIPLTSSFPFAYQETSGHERPQFDYRRQSLPNCPEVTFHGGTADIGLNDPTHFGSLRKQPHVRHSMLQQNENMSLLGEDPYGPRHKPRHNSAHPYARSSSPGPATISCTVAVIKAQAFGALRRTRAKPKKETDGAAKVAMNVLEARGIGVGPTPGSAHPRHDDDDLDVGTP